VPTNEWNYGIQLDERERDGGMEKDIKQASYMICYNVTLRMPIMWKNALIAPSKSRRT